MISMDAVPWSGVKESSGSGEDAEMMISSVSSTVKSSIGSKKKHSCSFEPGCAPTSNDRTVVKSSKSEASVVEF